MSNKDLIYQYVNTGVILTPYQISRLSNNLKNSYFKKRIKSDDLDGWEYKQLPKSIKNEFLDSLSWYQGYELLNSTLHNPNNPNYPTSKEISLDLLNHNNIWTKPKSINLLTTIKGLNPELLTSEKMDNIITLMDVKNIEDEATKYNTIFKIINSHKEPETLENDLVNVVFKNMGFKDYMKAMGIANNPIGFYKLAKKNGVDYMVNLPKEKLHLVSGFSKENENRRKVYNILNFNKK